MFRRAFHTSLGRRAGFLSTACLTNDTSTDQQPSTVRAGLLAETATPGLGRGLIPYPGESDKGCRLLGPECGPKRSRVLRGGGRTLHHHHSHRLRLRRAYERAPKRENERRPLERFQRQTGNAVPACRHTPFEGELL